MIELNNDEKKDLLSIINLNILNTKLLNLFKDFHLNYGDKEQFRKHFSYESETSLWIFLRSVIIKIIFYYFDEIVNLSKEPDLNESSYKKYELKYLKQNIFRIKRNGIVFKARLDNDNIEYIADKILAPYFVISSSVKKEKFETFNLIKSFYEDQSRNYYYAEGQIDRNKEKDIIELKELKQFASNKNFQSLKSAIIESAKILCKRDNKINQSRIADLIDIPISTMRDRCSKAGIEYKTKPDRFIDKENNQIILDCTRFCYENSKYFE